MPLEVKICGINAPDALDAAAAGGADLLGFMFFPKSPRAVTPEQAAGLASRLKPGVGRVAVLVDPDDGLLREVTGRVPLDFLQLHGAESPRRVAEIRARTGLAVIKVLKVASAEDLEAAETYIEVADRLLFRRQAAQDHDRRAARRQRARLRLAAPGRGAAGPSPGCCRAGSTGTTSPRRSRSPAPARWTSRPAWKNARG